jgi:prolyl-tRNA synthetase
VKFKDADLIGFPIRVNVGGRALKDGNVEIVSRRDKSSRPTPKAEAVAAVRRVRDELAG